MPNVCRSKDLCKEEYTQFRSLVGALQWLVSGSRPDLAFETLTHSCKMKKATKEDLYFVGKTIKRAQENVRIRFTGLGNLNNWKLIVYTLAAETMALIEGIEECIFLKSLLIEMKVFRYNNQIVAFVDNLGLKHVLYSTKLVDDKQTRIDIAAVQQLLQISRINNIEWCSTENQLANALTKKSFNSKSLLDTLSSGGLI